MKQLAIISGKGGTGKTSLVAAFASLAGSLVTVDCDVDAADLHLILEPTIKQTESFEGGLVAQINPDECVQCGECIDLCRFDAISSDFVVDPFQCDGCGVCHDHCPLQCIELSRETAGEWFVSDTRFGPMVHAKLGIAQENSGKLVAQVRQKAREIAQEKELDVVLIDSSPGIGCPVISSITGVDIVLVITEPTLSGVHDLKRVLELAGHFSVPSAVCVNKYDINSEISKQIELAAKKARSVFAGQIPFDNTVTKAMVAKKTLIEFGDSPAAGAVRKIWETTENLLFNEAR